MGFAFRAMIWIIGFNLAVGITILAFGQQNWLLTPGGLPANTGEQQTDDLNVLMNTAGTVPVEDISIWNRLLDFISIGFFNKIQTFLDQTIFSIPKLLNSMGILPESLQGYFNAGIILVFVLGMFELFTGRDLTLR